MKEMTEQQVLIKLTAVCAKAEHCLSEMKQKMDRWEIDKDTQDKVLKYLVDEKYIDEERFAKAFIRSKLQYNHWGRRKIEQALYMKRIPREIYESLLDEQEEDSYEDILLPLLQNKAKSVKGNSDYERCMKLIRFAMQRGFTYDQAQKCLDKIAES